MITLFVSNGELIAALIFTALMALYGWSKYSLARQIELDAKIRNMSDAEIVDRFQSFMKDNNPKPTLWEGREIYCILDAMEKRDLLKKIPDAELIDKFSQFKADCEKKHTFWRWRKFTYLQKEMERRKLA